MEATFVTPWTTLVVLLLATCNFVTSAPALSYDGTLKENGATPQHISLTMSVNPKKMSGLLGDHFLSLSLDPVRFIKKSKAGPGSVRTLAVARGLSPAYLRLAGPSSDTLRFARDNAVTTNDTVSERDLELLASWARDAGLDLMLCLNALVRADGVWDSRNTLDLLAFADRMGYSISWQLGYETAKLERSGVTASQLGADLTRARTLLSEFPRYQRALLLGPDVVAPLSGRSSKEAAHYLLDVSKIASPAPDVVVWQPWPSESDGRDPVQDPDLVREDVNRILGRASARRPLWISESGDESTSLFEDAINWALRIQVAVRVGAEVIFRQPDLHGDSHQPSPDYWVSLLHKRLCGRAVLDSRLAGNRSTVSVVSQCTSVSAGKSPGPRLLGSRLTYDQGSVTMFAVNKGSLAAQVNLKLGSVLSHGVLHEYILTAPGEDLRTMGTLLNGEPLLLDNGGGLPVVSPVKKEIDRNVILVVPPHSVAFFVLPNAHARVCLTAPPSSEDAIDSAIRLKSSNAQEMEVSVDMDGLPEAPFIKPLPSFGLKPHPKIMEEVTANDYHHEDQKNNFETLKSKTKEKLAKMTKERSAKKVKPIMHDYTSTEVNEIENKAERLKKLRLKVKEALEHLKPIHPIEEKALPVASAYSEEETDEHHINEHHHSRRKRAALSERLHRLTAEEFMERMKKRKKVPSQSEELSVIPAAESYLPEQLIEKHMKLPKKMINLVMNHRPLALVHPHSHTFNIHQPALTKHKMKLIPTDQEVEATLFDPERSEEEEEDDDIIVTADAADKSDVNFPTGILYAKTGDKSVEEGSKEFDYVQDDEDTDRIKEDQEDDFADEVPSDVEKDKYYYAPAEFYDHLKRMKDVKTVENADAGEFGEMELDGEPIDAPLVKPHKKEVPLQDFDIENGPLVQTPRLVDVKKSTKEVLEAECPDDETEILLTLGKKYIKEHSLQLKGKDRNQKKREQASECPESNSDDVNLYESNKVPESDSKTKQGPIECFGQQENWGGVPEAKERVKRRLRRSVAADGDGVVHTDEIPKSKSSINFGDPLHNPDLGPMSKVDESDSEKEVSSKNSLRDKDGDDGKNDEEKRRRLNLEEIKELRRRRQKERREKAERRSVMRVPRRRLGKEDEGAEDQSSSEESVRKKRSTQLVPLNDQKHRLLFESFGNFDSILNQLRLTDQPKCLPHYQDSTPKRHHYPCTKSRVINLENDKINADESKEDGHQEPAFVAHHKHHEEGEPVEVIHCHQQPAVDHITPCNVKSCKVCNPHLPGFDHGETVTMENYEIAPCGLKRPVAPCHQTPETSKRQRQARNSRSQTGPFIQDYSENINPWIRARNLRAMQNTISHAPVIVEAPDELYGSPVRRNHFGPGPVILPPNREVNLHAPVQEPHWNQPRPNIFYPHHQLKSMPLENAEALDDLVENIPIAQYPNPIVRESETVPADKLVRYFPKAVNEDALNNFDESDNWVPVKKPVPLKKFNRKDIDEIADDWEKVEPWNPAIFASKPNAWAPPPPANLPTIFQGAEPSRVEPLKKPTKQPYRLIHSAPGDLSFFAEPDKHMPLQHPTGLLSPEELWVQPEAPVPVAPKFPVEVKEGHDQDLAQYENTADEAAETAWSDDHVEPSATYPEESLPGQGVWDAHSTPQEYTTEVWPSQPDDHTPGTFISEAPQPTPSSKYFTWELDPPQFNPKPGKLIFSTSSLKSRGKRKSEDPSSELNPVFSYDQGYKWEVGHKGELGKPATDTEPSKKKRHATLGDTRTASKQNPSEREYIWVVKKPGYMATENTGDDYLHQHRYKRSVNYDGLIRAPRSPYPHHITGRKDANRQGEKTKLPYRSHHYDPHAESIEPVSSPIKTRFRTKRESLFDDDSFGMPVMEPNQIVQELPNNDAEPIDVKEELTPEQMKILKQLKASIHHKNSDSETPEKFRDPFEEAKGIVEEVDSSKAIDEIQSILGDLVKMTNIINLMQNETTNGNTTTEANENGTFLDYFFPFRWGLFGGGNDDSHGTASPINTEPTDSAPKATNTESHQLNDWLQGQAHHRITRDLAVKKEPYKADGDWNSDNVKEKTSSKRYMRATDNHFGQNELSNKLSNVLQTILDKLSGVIGYISSLTNLNNNKKSKY